MKANPISFAGTILLALFCNLLQAQSFGPYASAVWLSDCNQSNFFNTSGNPADEIGPSGNVFNNANLGVHTQNSGTLFLNGAQVKTFKNPMPANVCGVKMFYRVYLQSGAPGAFASMDLPFLEDCSGSTYPSGGPCQPGDQKWQQIAPIGSTSPAPINLTAFPTGNYVLEIYYEVTGSNSSISGCTDLVTLNNGGSNYKAIFSIQSPTLSSTNPSSCFGSQGSITIGGLTAGASYLVSYTDDGAPVGPLPFVANGAGQVIITGLNAGVYANISLQVNGCTTGLFTGIILSDPIFVPSFNAIPPFCAGTPAPTLPATSLNGLAGTWNPATVSNTASGAYTFTPTTGQCALPVTINITVIQRTTPVFPFGTSRVICNGGAVPALPNTSTNGIAGTWSPNVVSNTTSGVYTFTPNAGLCANPTTFTVTVNPNITPSFSFGTSTTICSGATAPTLPGTSTNGINGTWSPATVSNTASATYTFTPTAGQCAVPTTLDVTVNPNVTPTFPFGTSLNICNGGSVPTLTTTSIEGVTGTWSPSTVSNTASATYTFTPTAGLCALQTTFSVSVNPNITPTFAYGTSLVICAGGVVPTLVNTSQNGITGTWSPAVVDNQNSGVYTFTPDAGQCALPATYTVTVNPNITPAFSFGTSTTICNGAAVPALPATSTNGINGTWSPATVSNTASATYTFTPTAGQCAVPTTFDVTVNPNVTPTFPFGTSLNICNGGSVPTLTTTSIEGITGTWSPSTVSNTASATYTFTPTAGLCALPTTFSVSVAPNIPPIFSYGSNLTICAGGTVPTLVNTSQNGITGTWSPATVDNMNSGVYIFTPTAGQCALTAAFTVTVNPNITPAFSFGTSTTICNGSTAPTLPTTSTNGITGTWSPATVSNTASGTYTFTPTPGLCAVPTTFTVTVDPNVTPTFAFGTSLTLCSGGSVPTLTTTSIEGITGAWSPATVSNTASGTYTFTPTAGLCAVPVTFTVTVNPNIPPTFSYGTSLTICSGGTVPTLVGTSTNGITGTWSPAIVDNLNSGTYTFTPDAGQCALTATFTVTVNPNILPTFSFGTNIAICNGSTPPALPTTSTNGITGTWSPATINNTTSGTYTFTPTPGLCALPTTLNVTVDVNIAPTFAFGSSLTICSGGIVPALPTTSSNGITGTWSPATVSNTASATYTFTPTAGQCALPATYTVTVNPNITPTFAFGTSLTICANSAVPALPGTSTNGITGTWSPATVDNQNSAVYTFTPDAGLCAVPATFTVTVNPNVTPAFSFGAAATICAGSVPPVLPNTSSNGITGTWSPAIVDNQNSGTYTFTPTAGQCVQPAVTTFTVTVTPNTIPTFSFGTSLSICVGGTVPVLPTTSDNGVTGTWTPAVVSNQTSGTYIFTPSGAVCALGYTYTVSVSPILTPAFSFGTSQSVCINSTPPTLIMTSTNGVLGTWSPSVVDNQVSGTYTFTPDPGQCANPATFNYQVNPIPVISIRSDTSVVDGASVPGYTFTATPGTTISWVNSNPAIGLPASGTGNIPAFTAVNLGNSPITATITVTPRINGCTGATKTYTITVLPLNKDVFVPNVFSPNGDGKNDILYVYGNYITSVDMRIFNQWGQQIAMINNKAQGWNGFHKGNPQPVGVYVYVLKAGLSNGQTVNLKGSITLVR